MTVSDRRDWQLTKDGISRRRVDECHREHIEVEQTIECGKHGTRLIMCRQLGNKVIGPEWIQSKPHNCYSHADRKYDEHQDRHELEPQICTPVTRSTVGFNVPTNTWWGQVRGYQCHTDGACGGTCCWRDKLQRLVRLLWLSKIPVWHQTYGYLPSHRPSPSFCWYQIILLGDRDACVWTTCPELLHESETTENWTHDLLNASPMLEPLHHNSTHAIVSWWYTNLPMSPIHLLNVNWKPTSYNCYECRQFITSHIHKHCDQYPVYNLYETVKPSFHYPSWRPKLTGVKKCTRVDGP